MTKKVKQTDTDTAIAAWRTAQAATAAAIAERNRTPRGETLASCLSEKRVALAEDAERHAALEASVALDEREGDELAVATHRQVDDAILLAKRLHEEWQSAARQVAIAAEDARSQWAAKAARRAAAGWPVESFPTVTYKGVMATSADLRDALARRVENGPVPSKSNAVQIARLEHDESKFRIARELARLEKEEAAAHAAKLAASNEKSRLAGQADAVERGRQARERQAAETARLASLVAADRAREESVR